MVQREENMQKANGHFKNLLKNNRGKIKQITLHSLKNYRQYDICNHLKTSKKNLKGPETGYYKPEESEKLAMLI